MYVCAAPEDSCPALPRRETANLIHISPSHVMYVCDMGKVFEKNRINSYLIECLSNGTWGSQLEEDCVEETKGKYLI